MIYDHKTIDEKWQRIWKDANLYQTQDAGKKEKYYVLDMFPYPSGEGLHVGHPKGYIATDVIARQKMMQGFDVLHPMGWDAFGLPAENYALKHKVHPSVAVKENIKRFKEQIEKIGFTYDWSREINTTDPAYYKWTQWIFLQMFKKGLAFESFAPINWCPSCQTGLANEDVENGRCERCGSLVEKRPMRQWVLKITDYAERLLADLEILDWPESIKEAQRNWIGKSEGVEISFLTTDGTDKITVFTTRPDTILGATYLVLSPEHALIHKFENKIENLPAVKKYIESAAQKTEIERTNVGKEKTGVELKGISAINPATKESIPVWIADYVLMDYGTGAIMAVPAHDERDFQFAKKYNLEIREIVLSDTIGKKSLRYKLRDWVFSRQRYWGEPIPIIHCEKCGVVPVPEKDLPVLLPDVESYEPTGTGESPLANIPEWLNVDCPKCGGQGKRETNTMPQWAGSCWYYLRYIDPKNDKNLVDVKKEKHWLPVDTYVGGAEHATRHLIYARFWHKFLYDIKIVSKSEPFARYANVGLILAADGKKMSKRWGNVVNPDDMVAKYGADAFRIYEMFLSPFGQSANFLEDGVAGAKSFLNRIFLLKDKISHIKPDDQLQTLLHQTIKKVGEDIENFKFNTAISALMILANAFGDVPAIDEKDFAIFLQLLAPFAPHSAEELWQAIGMKESIFKSDWPKFNPKFLVNTMVTIAVQVNGKLRDTFEIAHDATEDKIKITALERENVKKWIEGSDIKKIIVVKGKLINIVI